MFFVVLPAADTRKIGWRDVFLAATAAHTLGLVAGSVLNLSLGRLTGWHVDTGLVAGFWWIANLPLVPVTVLFGYLGSRIGLIGFGASLVAGAAIGVPASLAWAEHASHFAEHVWLGLCYGLPASGLYWAVLRLRRPEAFAADPLARGVPGLLAYAGLLVVAVGVPFTPKMLAIAEADRANRAAIAAFEALLRDQLWDEAARGGTERFRAFVGEVDAAKGAIRFRDEMVRARVDLAEILQTWGLVDRSRAEFLDAARIAGYPMRPDPCTTWHEILSRQLDGGDYFGTHLSCLGLPEHQISSCFVCLAADTQWTPRTLERRGLPFAPIAPLASPWRPEGALALWREGRLGSAFRADYAMGGVELVEARAAEIPDGAARAEAYVDWALAHLREKEPEAAGLAFRMAADALGRETSPAVADLASDTLFGRIGEAWIMAGDTGRAREAIRRIENAERRARMLLRLAHP